MQPQSFDRMSDILNISSPELTFRTLTSDVKLLNKHNPINP